MNSRITARRPSPAIIVAVTALVVAMSGVAAALPGKNTVDKNDLKKGAVKTKALKNAAVTNPKLADGSVTGSKLADGSVTGGKLADGAVGGAKVADGAISGAKIAAGAVDGGKVADNSLSDAKLSDYEVIGNSFVRVTATEGANADAARTAAPETLLFSKGQLTVYAKCFRDVAADTTFGKVYSRTTADGAIQEGEDDLPGGNAATQFLNTATLEVDRELDTEDAVANDADYDESEFSLAAPDGTGLHGQLVVGAKNGTLAGGNGLYGSGNVCVFQGSLLG